MSTLTGTDGTDALRQDSNRGTAPTRNETNPEQAVEYLWFTASISRPAGAVRASLMCRAAPQGRLISQASDLW